MIDDEKEIDNPLDEPAQDSGAVEAENDLDDDASDQLRLVEDHRPDRETTIDQIVEAILFSSETPLSAQRIASAIGGLTPKQVRQIIETLNAKYERDSCAFRIEELAGGYQMLTLPEFAHYLQRLYRVRSDSRLSAAALETLAVVAYKQPVVRAEVEAIRGVACGELLRSLMEKGLIKIVGRAEELGRPMLYGTTRRFLEIFGLRSLDDLPRVPQLQMPQQQTKDQGQQSSENNQPEPTKQEDQPDPSDTAQ